MAHWKLKIGDTIEMEILYNISKVIALINKN